MQRVTLSKWYNSLCEKEHQRVAEYQTDVTADVTEVGATNPAWYSDFIFVVLTDAKQ